MSDWLSVCEASSSAHDTGWFRYFLTVAENKAADSQTAIVLIKDEKFGDYVLMTRREFEALHGDIYQTNTLGEVTGFASVDDLGC